MATGTNKVSPDVKQALDDLYAIMQESGQSYEVPVLDAEGRATGQTYDYRYGRRGNQPSPIRLQEHLDYLSQQQGAQYQPLTGRPIPDFQVADPYESETTGESVKNTLKMATNESLVGLGFKAATGEDLFNMEGFQPGKIESVAAGVLSFLSPVDLAVMAVGGGVGGIAVKGLAQKALTKYAIKELGKEGAEKLMTKVIKKELLEKSEVELLKAGRKAVAKEFHQAIPTAAGALGAHTGVSKFLESTVEHGDLPLDELFSKSIEAGIIGVGQGALLGAATAGAGGISRHLVSKLSKRELKSIELATEIAALGTATPLIFEARTPTTDDYANAAGFVIGLRLAGGVPKLAKMAYRAWKRRNPGEAETQNLAEELVRRQRGDAAGGDFNDIVLAAASEAVGAKPGEYALDKMILKGEAVVVPMVPEGSTVARAVDLTAMLRARVEAEKGKHPTPPIGIKKFESPEGEAVVHTFVAKDKKGRKLGKEVYVVKKLDSLHAISEVFNVAREQKKGLYLDPKVEKQKVFDLLKETGLVSTKRFNDKYLKLQVPRKLDRAEFRNQVERASPNLKKVEVDAVLDIVQARAESVGLPVDEYIQTRFFERAVIEGKGELGNWAKGSVRFLNDNRAVITAFKRADVSTMAHELGHVFRRDLSRDLLREAEKFVGAQSGEMWSVKQEERFARAFERYLAEGKAPSAELKTVFERFKRWMVNIYKKISKSEIGEAITPEIRRVFAKMLTAQKDAGKKFEEVKATPGSTFGGNVYRISSGFKGDKTAEDVIKSNADLLEKPSIIEQAKESGVDLSKHTAEEMVWVTKTKELAESYGAPEKIELPEGSRIIATDGEGGLLVLTNPNPHILLQRLEESKRGIAFISPNYFDGLDIKKAVQRLFSDEHQRNKAMFADIIKQLRIPGRLADAVGTWATGAENTVVLFLRGVKSYDDIKYAASIAGRVSHQKAIIPFIFDVEGKDRMYRFRFSEDSKIPLQKMATQFEQLVKDGLQLDIEYSTIAKVKNNYDFYLFSSGFNPQLESNVIKLGEKYGTEPKAIWGNGEVFGSWTSRAEGTKLFTNFISLYETSFPDRKHYRAVHSGERGGAAADRSIKESLFQEVEKSKKLEKEHQEVVDKERLSPGGYDFITSPAKIENAGAGGHGFLTKKTKSGWRIYEYEMGQGSTERKQPPGVIVKNVLRDFDGAILKFATKKEAEAYGLKLLESEAGVTTTKLPSATGTGDIWVGTAYRADPQRFGRRDETAKDIVDFEADEMGNEHVREDAYGVAKKLGIDLSKIEGRDIDWVAKDRKVAESYSGTAEKPNPKEVQKIKFPEGSVILAEDGDGGFLVLTAEAPELIRARSSVKDVLFQSENIWKEHKESVKQTIKNLGGEAIYRVRNRLKLPESKELVDRTEKANWVRSETHTTLMDRAAKFDLHKIESTHEAYKLADAIEAEAAPAWNNFFNNLLDNLNRLLPKDKKIPKIKGYFTRMLKTEVREKLYGDVKELKAQLKSIEESIKGEPNEKATAKLRQILLSRSAETRKAIEYLLKTGGAKDLRDALRKLDQEVEAGLFITPWFTRKRTQELPAEFYERDPRIVIPKYLEAYAKYYAETIVFGADHKKALKLLRDIEIKDPEEFKIVQKAMSMWSGLYDLEHSYRGKVKSAVDAFTAFEVATKIGMGFGTLLNTTQFIISFMPQVGFWEAVRAGAKVFDPVYRATLRGIGIVDNYDIMALRAAIGYDVEGKVGRLSYLVTKWSGFQAINRLNLYWAASAIDGVIPKWHRDAQGIGKRATLAQLHLKDLGIDYKKSLESQEGQRRNAIYQFATKTQLQRNVFDEPMFMNETRLKPLLLFKRFGWRQANLIKDMLVKEVHERKNYMPLVRLAAGGMLGGTAVVWAQNMIKELLSGEPTYEKDDVWWREYLDRAATIGAFGMMSDILAVDKFSQAPSKIGFTLKPVLLSDIEKFGEAWTTVMKDWENYGDAWLATKRNAEQIFTLSGTLGSLPRALAKRTLTGSQAENRVRYLKAQEKKAIFEFMLNGDGDIASKRIAQWNANYKDDDGFSMDEVGPGAVLKYLKQQGEKRAAANAEKGTPEFKKRQREERQRAIKQFVELQQQR